MPRGFTWVAALSIVAGLAWRLPAQDAPVIWDWQLPAGFPPPRIPGDNPMSRAEADLGRRLFYDTRMSANGTQSCANPWTAMRTSPPAR